MKGNLLLIILLVFILPTYAQKLSAKVDKDKILIGEQFQLRLQANFKKDEPIDFYIIDTIARFEILSKSAIDTSRFDDGFALIQELTMTSWDSGKIRIPPFELEGHRTGAITIDVAYAPSPFDTTQPYHDIHDIVGVKRPLETTWYWYLIGLLILILLFLLFFPKAKPKGKGEFVSDEGAYKKALKKLDALKRSGPSDAKLFHTELVHVFREYLNKRLNIYSFSKTTEDLSQQIEKLNMDREPYRALVETLTLSDLVKYAKYQPATRENEESLEAVRESIITIENNHVPRLKPQSAKI